jgi:cytochrome c biogenesis protein CcdA
MSLSVLGDLNWLAVIVATIAYFALGAIWYAEFAFGKMWAKSVGWDLAPPENAGVGLYAVPLATCFVATLATAMIGAASSTDNIMEGILLGLVVGIGLALPVMFVSAIYDTTKPSPLTYVTVGGGYHIVGLVLAGAILGLWR